MKKLLDKESIEKLKLFLLNSKRPILLVGHGVELGNAQRRLIQLLQCYQIPVVWSQGGINVLPSTHPLNIGKIGTKGSRAGNFAVQNADLIISIGSRLSVSTTGQNYELFGREAKLIVLDTDNVEHTKNTVKIDLFIEADANDILYTIHHHIYDSNGPNCSEWVQKCQHWKEIFPVYQPEFSKTDKVNMYYFIEELSNQLRENDVVVADAGSAMFVTSQGLRFGETNKVILSHAQAEMGFTIPACIGVACAKQGDVIGITGDGSFQMNIQELQTIKHHNLPIKLFVWNNEGYLSQRHTQMSYFGRLTGADASSGVSFPDLQKIAYAYGIPYVEAASSTYLPFTIEYTLSKPGPVICEIQCLKEQDILTIKSKQVDGKFVSMPLEDMYPYLDRKIFMEEMVIKPLECSLK